MFLKIFKAGLLCAALAMDAVAGTLRTFDGRTLTGTVTLETDAKLTLTLTPRTGNPTKHSLDDALWVNFLNADSARTRRWISQDIGAAVPAGRSRIQGDSLSITGGGVAMDQFHMTHQAIRGDVSIRAKVNSVGKSDLQAFAGLVFRASAENNAAFVYIAFTAGGGGIVCVRSANASITTRNFPGKLPGWLKLTREGDAFGALTSDDGKTWTPVWNANIAMPAQLLVGAMAHSNNKSMLTTAGFESVGVETKDPSDNGFKGVILREGSKIACNIISANDSTTHVKRALDADLPIPLSEISRIVWRGAGDRQAADIPRGKTGALLTGGDFFEGTLAGLSDSKARISSVLFGLREFEASKIQTLCLSSPKNSPTRYIVKLNDGSTLFTDKITADKSNLAAEIDGVGLVRFTRENLVEIRAGESRYQSMADYRPIKSANMFEATPAGITPSLRGAPADHFIGFRAGGAVSWSIPSDAKIFSARLGVPDGVLPSTAMRFIIKLDDREIYRGAAMTSLSDEASVSIPVSSAKTISISVESEMGAFGGIALLADPAMVK